MEMGNSSVQQPKISGEFDTNGNMTKAPNILLPTVKGSPGKHRETTNQLGKGLHTMQYKWLAFNNWQEDSGKQSQVWSALEWVQT